jgi:hypothetical protein
VYKSIARNSTFIFLHPTTPSPRVSGISGNPGESWKRTKFFAVAANHIFALVSGMVTKERMDLLREVTEEELIAYDAFWEGDLGKGAGVDIGMLSDNLRVILTELLRYPFGQSPRHGGVSVESYVIVRFGFETDARRDISGDSYGYLGQRYDETPNLTQRANNFVFLSLTSEFTRRMRELSDLDFQLDRYVFTDGPEEVTFAEIPRIYEDQANLLIDQLNNHVSRTGAFARFSDIVTRGFDNEIPVGTSLVMEPLYYVSSELRLEPLLNSLPVFFAKAVKETEDRINERRDMMNLRYLTLREVIYRAKAGLIPKEWTTGIGAQNVYGGLIRALEGEIKEDQARDNVIEQTTKDLNLRQTMNMLSLIWLRDSTRIRSGLEPRSRLSILPTEILRSISEFAKDIWPDRFLEYKLTVFVGEYYHTNVTAIKKRVGKPPIRTSIFHEETRLFPEEQDQVVRPMVTLVETIAASILGMDFEARRTEYYEKGKQTEIYNVRESINNMIRDNQMVVDAGFPVLFQTWMKNIVAKVPTPLTQRQIESGRYSPFELNVEIMREILRQHEAGLPILERVPVMARRNIKMLETHLREVEENINAVDRAVDEDIPIVQDEGEGREGRGKRPRRDYRMYTKARYRLDYSACSDSSSRMPTKETRGDLASATPSMSHFVPIF